MSVYPAPDDRAVLELLLRQKAESTAMPDTPPSDFAVGNVTDQTPENPNAKEITELTKLIEERKAVHQAQVQMLTADRSGNPQDLPGLVNHALSRVFGPSSSDFQKLKTLRLVTDDYINQVQPLEERRATLMAPPVTPEQQAEAEATKQHILRLKGIESNKEVWKLLGEGLPEEQRLPFIVTGDRHFLLQMTDEERMKLFEQYAKMGEDIGGTKPPATKEEAFARGSAAAAKKAAADAAAKADKSDMTAAQDSMYSSRVQRQYNANIDRILKHQGYSSSSVMGVDENNNITNTTTHPGVPTDVMDFAERQAFAQLPNADREYAKQNIPGIVPIEQPAPGQGGQPAADAAIEQGTYLKERRAKVAAHKAAAKKAAADVKAKETSGGSGN